MNKFGRMPPGQRCVNSATLHIGIAKGLPERMRAGTRELISLEVPLEDRRKGLATRLMERVCAEADGSSMVLLLTVQPYNDAGITDQGRLKAFYERFGFAQIQAEPLMMARQPIARSRPHLIVAHAVRQAMH